MTVHDQSNDVATATATSNALFSTPETNEHLSALTQEKARLENCVTHLLRSNVELTEALRTDPDEEYANAVKENKRTINSHQGEIYNLAVEISGITGNVNQFTPRPPGIEPPLSTPAAEQGQWL